MRRRSWSRRCRAIVLAAAALTYAGASCSAPQTESPAGGVHEEVLSVDGEQREFSYFVPTGTGIHSRPVVIYLHGHGDNMRHILGKGLMSSASSVWMRVADRENFLVLFPLGAKGPGWRGKTGWNDCRAEARGNPDVDDIAFLRSLISYAITELKGDRGRVYVTGMSNGGHMAMRVAMEMSSEVAAIATIVALLPTTSPCSPPSLPIPILMMFGTEDPIAPFLGGSMPQGRGTVLSARETIDRWVQWNRLDDIPESTTQLPDVDCSDDSRILVRTRERSPGGIAVVAYEMQGAGHTEPSQVAKQGRVLRNLQGNQNHDIEMAEAIWKFFRLR